MSLMIDLVQVECVCRKIGTSLKLYCMNMYLRDMRDRGCSALKAHASTVDNAILAGEHTQF